MEFPDLETERVYAVQQAKLDGIPKDEVWSYLQHVQQMQFESHALEITIEHIYEDDS